MKKLLVLSVLLIMSSTSFACETSKIAELELTEVNSPAKAILVERPFFYYTLDGSQGNKGPVRASTGRAMMGRSAFSLNIYWVKISEEGEVLIQGSDSDFIRVKGDNKDVNTVQEFNEKHGEFIKICQ